MGNSTVLYATKHEKIMNGFVFKKTPENRASKYFFENRKLFSVEL